MGEIPTPQEVLEEYRRFNTWELEEQERVLSRSSVEEGQTQFLEQCDLARTLAPDTAIVFSNSTRRTGLRDAKNSDEWWRQWTKRKQPGAE